MHILAVEREEDYLKFLVLFSDDSVQLVEFKELMDIAPHLRIRHIDILFEFNYL